MKTIVRNSTSVTRSIGALALACIFTFGTSAWFTTDAEAIPCRCTQFSTTSQGWGTGLTCTASKNACISNALANAACTVCDVTGVTYTNECDPHVDGSFSGFMSDCIVSHTCEIGCDDMGM